MPTAGAAITISLIFIAFLLAVLVILIAMSVARPAANRRDADDRKQKGSQNRPGIGAWWPLVTALLGLTIGAALVFAGRATPSEAGTFIAPLFTMLGIVQINKRPRNPRKDSDEGDESDES
ncbi:hypothetical protein ACWGDT_40585 [Streptomyces avermitilis]